MILLSLMAIDIQVKMLRLTWQLQKVFILKLFRTIRCEKRIAAAAV
jgi:hypothetical protein